MDMVRQITTRSIVYEVLGRFLFSAGLVLACFLGIRIAREAVDRRIAQQPNYLVIPSTPIFGLPPATPLPTLTQTSVPTPTPTQTPLPTATPLPLPAIRLSIPAIKVNARIQEIFPTEKRSSNGEYQLVWEPVAFAVAHYNTSGYPGAGRNIVLVGHNNTEGEVFRYLNDLNPGDEVILFNEIKEFHYQVQQKVIIPYLGSEREGEAQLQAFAAPQPAEMVTLISCWPYATNANRIVVIAAPIPGWGENGG
jgi:LPXTG-site transpeptidase (sortase) family protein